MSMRDVWAEHDRLRAELDRDRALAYAVDDFWLADRIEERMSRLYHPKWTDPVYWQGFRRRHASELGGAS